MVPFLAAKSFLSEATKGKALLACPVSGLRESSASGMAGRLFRFSRRVWTSGVASVAVLQLEQRSPFNAVNDAAAPSTESSVPTVDGEADEWEIEKEKCSFCKTFLKSPCKVPFKNWSMCVDKAKEEEVDFVSKCSEFTNALLECTSQNSEHFAELNKGDDVNPEDGADADGDGKAEAENVKLLEGGEESAVEERLTAKKSD